LKHIKLFYPEWGDNSVNNKLHLTIQEQCNLPPRKTKTKMFTKQNKLILYKTKQFNLSMKQNNPPNKTR